MDEIPDELTEYFDLVGIVRQVSFATLPQTGRNLTCAATFQRHEAVRRVIPQENHSLCYQKVRVGSVGFAKYDSVVDLLKDP